LINRYKNEDYVTLKAPVTNMLHAHIKCMFKWYS